MKIKEFCKKHKDEIEIAISLIAVGGGMFVTALVTTALLKNDLKPAKGEGIVQYAKAVACPESLTKLGFETFDNYRGAVEVMTNTKYDTIKVSDLGKLGEALCDLPDIDENCYIWTLVNVSKNK